MCATCGCGENAETIRFTLHGETAVHDMLDHGHYHEHHHHSHDDHNHSHLHSYEHSHDHHGHHHHHNESKVIEIEQNILRENDLLAQRNRGYFEAKDIHAFNLVSSPGSGKTSLLERTLSDLKGKYPFYVIEGDQQTMNDADRIAATSTPVLQINTGKACHLDASMINRAIKKLNPANDSILFVENVGNLVCPAMFDLGESKRVVIISVTEGDDKAIKYPDMFHTAHLCIINKIDLLPYVNFDVAKAKEYALRVNHHLEFIEVSATNGEGMNLWYDWLAHVSQIN